MAVEGNQCPRRWQTYADSPSAVQVDTGVAVNEFRRSAVSRLIGVSAFIALGGSAGPALSATAADLDKEAAASLAALYQANPSAEKVAKQAKAILVFPRMIKAGLVFGGGYGEGVLMVDGRSAAYYNSVTGSLGLQAGWERYAYALFLMNDKAMKHLERTKGWEIGVGPGVVVFHSGAARNLSTSTLRDDVYAFVYDQQGLMGTVSLEGTKISHIKR